MTRPSPETQVRQRVADFAEVFNSESGKRVLLDLMRYGNMLGPAFDPNPSVAAFNEGRRDVVSYIMATIQMDDLAFYKFVRGAPSMAFGDDAEPHNGD